MSDELVALNLAMGRDKGMRGPVGVEHLCYEPDEPREVILRVHDLRTRTDATMRHWDLIWHVSYQPWCRPSTRGGPIRVLQCVREAADHCTNWGPGTYIRDTREDTRAYILGSLGLKDREVLDEIGSNTPVRTPEGEHDTQSWMEAVLRTAVVQGLMTTEAVDAALAGARQP